jgi:hypothetical protein
MVFGFVAAIVVGFLLTAVQIANYWLMIAAATLLVYGPWLLMAPRQSAST